MDNKKFKNLIKKDEGMKLDFKQKIDVYSESGKKELAKDICAIANSRGGRGYIVIGIEDKTKKVIGMGEFIIKEEQIQQIVSSRCNPPIPISLEFLKYQEKEIAIITIYEGNQKPYQLRENGAFYIRRGSTTDTMRKDELISLLNENLSLNIETIPVIASSLNSLDLQLVNKYFKLKGISIDEDNRAELMDNAGITHLQKDYGERVLTLGGLLVFSKLNSIYTPHNMIRIINKTNSNMKEITIIQGSLLEMIDKAEEEIKKILPVNYPVEAVYEAIKNAVLYRDYTMFYKEIEIIIDYNSVSVISPGDLTMCKEIKSHNYLKRNMWIYEKLITLDDKGRFIKSGRGFTRMKKAFSKYGKVLFVNIQETNSFKVIFPGIKIFYK